jgi:hypothetical protein
MSATTSRSLRSFGSNPIRCVSSHAPATASSVLPVATAAAVQSGALLPAFAAKAPIQIAGHKDDPHSSSAARPIPVGAHTVVTCSATKAKRNPRSAAITYAIATAAPTPISRPGP